jgi:hypothetical protein
VDDGEGLAGWLAGSRMGTWSDGGWKCYVDGSLVIGAPDEGEGEVTAGWCCQKVTVLQESGEIERWKWSRLNTSEDHPVAGCTVLVC